MRRIRLFPEFGINVPDMPTTSHPDREARPLRADALRNRERILATARRLFAERGISVTLNDVAHEAGVGVGTVYRRFPDKHALVDALLSAKFETLSALVERAAACPTGREAMRAYLLGALELRASDRALADVIVRAHPASPALRRDRDRIDAEMTALVDRAHREARCERASRRVTCRCSSSWWVPWPTAPARATRTSGAGTGRCSSTGSARPPSSRRCAGAPSSVRSSSSR